MSCNLTRFNLESIAMNNSTSGFFYALLSRVIFATQRGSDRYLNEGVEACGSESAQDVIGCEIL